ncbi:ankyrin repeat protein [Trifolium medium]|uniref:Ankyrin repeat protein n=1 Tax=Trifolium medium TaxID=97028 RepID=A0A392MAM7_9FABA|nr:ankyrin repeat protein [Trifolium medium]
MATDNEIIKLLSSAGAKHSSKLSDSQTLASKHKPIITMWDEVEIYMSRVKNLISEEQRNTSMIIVTLIVTATYQSALSPPGGFNSSDNNVNITTSTNSTISSLGAAGKSVLSKQDFLWFSYFMYSRVHRRLNARKLNRPALLQSNTEIDTNTLTV